MLKYQEVHRVLEKLGILEYLEVRRYLEEDSEILKRKI